MRKGIDWDAEFRLHPGQSDGERARRLGVSRDTAKRARRRRRHPGGRRGYRFSRAWDAQPLGLVADAAIALTLGSHYTTVGDHRRRRGIPPFDPFGHLDWEAAGFGLLAPCAVAAALGIDKSLVYKRHRDLGVAMPSGPRLCSLCHKPGHDSRYCNASWLQLIGKVSDSEVVAARAAEGTTVSRQVISQMRKRRGIAARWGRPSSDRPAAGLIYFMSQLDRIKIGWTGRVAVLRLKDLDVGGYPTRLLATIPDQTKADEAALHRRFAADLAHGREWFHSTPGLLAFIAEHATPWTTTASPSAQAAGSGR